VTTEPVRIEKASIATVELVEAFERLLPQLSAVAIPDADGIQRIIDHDATTLLLAHDIDGGIVGMLTLATFATPTGVRSWIEDVVVDERSTGRGIASALINAATDVATRLGARTVDLTSRPSREAANRLYLRLGFDRRDTNVYRFSLEK
jgi:GNAT superfamily N-acetyltransferase